MYRSRKSKKNYNPSKVMRDLKSGDKNCPFCEMGKSQREVITETKHNLIVNNIHGYDLWEYTDVVEHLMIVPKKHVESLKDLNKQEKVDTIDLIAEWENKGYNVYAREKGNVIKSVPHQHTHLIKTKGRRAFFALYSKKPYILFKI